MQWPVDLASDPTLKKSFDVLRTKWGEVPAGEHDRVKTSELLRLNDTQILEAWEQAFRAASSGVAFAVRGWYQQIYQDVFRGKKVLDVGCGMAPDTIFYSAQGAALWFADIIPENVEYVRRVCSLKGLTRVNFLYIEELGSLDSLPYDFDAIYCCGSMINAPFAVTRMEVQGLLAHLPVGGRWVELGYPESRWEREGSLPFSSWGARTDGGAPWMEWKDLAKLKRLLESARFETVLSLDFHNSDFNWFDLIRRA
jgi:SAM-dependent methyltransferase